MASLPKVAIIGAGAGGLALANILQKNEVPFIVYEADASATARNQGGTLDLHPKAGQLALREAGLWDEFAKHARPESDVLKIVEPSGNVLWDGNGSDARNVAEAEKFDNRPEIDRGALQQLLLASLKTEYVQWGKKLVEAVPAESNTFDLHFSDNSVDQNVVVIGSDGAWSKVRQLVSPEKPRYSGISLVEFWALDAEKKNPWMADYIGKGSLFSFGEGRAIQIQRLGDGSIRTYASLRKPESFLKDCGIDWTVTDVARKDYVERYFADCGEDLKRVILESTDSAVPRLLYQLPVGFRWESRPGVTLLGDAAHLMTPFAGVGVNAAMMDALELGRAIVRCKESAGETSIASALAEYEAGLFPRGEANAQKTMGNMQKHFSAGGSEHLAKRLKAAYGKSL